MSSEAITRNDLKEILEEVLPRPNIEVSTTQVQISAGNWSINNITKYGRVVVLTAFLSGFTTSGEQIVGTVPEGYRPSVTIRGGIGYTGHPTSSEYFIVSPNGQFYINNSIGSPLVNAVYISAD